MCMTATSSSTCICEFFVWIRFGLVVFCSVQFSSRHCLVFAWYIIIIIIATTSEHRVIFCFIMDCTARNKFPTNNKDCMEHGMNKNEKGNKKEEWNEKKNHHNFVSHLWRLFGSSVSVLFQQQSWLKMSNSCISVSWRYFKQCLILIIIFLFRLFRVSSFHIVQCLSPFLALFHIILM